MAAATIASSYATPAVTTFPPPSNKSFHRSAFFGKAPGMYPSSAHITPSSSSSSRSRLVISAVVSDKYQVIQPLNGDPFIGSLETPVTSSPLVAWYLSNLPFYRTAVAPLLRGVEIGLAHGFFLVGPFVKTGPLRNTEVAIPAGSIAAAGLVVILTIWLTLYGISTFEEGAPPPPPSLTLTGRKKQPDLLQTAAGWEQFVGGFFFGGISGVTWAYLCLNVFKIPYPV